METTRKSKRAYLTKRILVSKAKSAGLYASRNAMITMGFVVTCDKGWVVKKYADGRKERIKRISSTENTSVAFD